MWGFMLYILLIINIVINQNIVADDVEIGERKIDFHMTFVVRDFHKYMSKTDIEISDKPSCKFGIDYSKWEDTLTLDSIWNVEVAQQEALCCCTTYDGSRCCGYVSRCGSLIPGCYCKTSSTPGYN